MKYKKNDTVYSIKNKFVTKHVVEDVSKSHSLPIIKVNGKWNLESGFFSRHADAADDLVIREEHNFGKF